MTFRTTFVCAALVLTSALTVQALANSPTNSETSTQTAPVLDERYKALETFARALHHLETMYVDPNKVKEEDLVMHALKGIVDNLDPHTMVMPRKAFEQLTSDTQGKFGGVGIIVSQERGKLIVVSPIEDTPAFKAGVKSGDEIIAIDGIPLSQLKNEDAVDRMRGDPGSVLKLQIRRKDIKDVLNFDLRREIIKVRSVRGQSLSQGIEYVRISSFQESTGEELQNILKDKSNTIRGLVLDLRDNPGGLLDQAVQVADLFIESGLIVSTVGRDNQRMEREFAKSRGTMLGFPIVVLVNGGSASASEIVAGALQDHERALILGTTTFGKGSVQTLVTLPDGSGLKLTIARYYTPKDRSIQAKGITPDIIITARKPGDEEIQVSDSAKPGEEVKRPRKEADLAGHIESQDLSDLSRTQGILGTVQKWPENMQNDNQLVTAYTYIKSWSIFQNRGPVVPKAQLGPVTPEPAK
jgi:carboxyl-terminal processing protease